MLRVIPAPKGFVSTASRDVYSDNQGPGHGKPLDTLAGAGVTKEAKENNMSEKIPSLVELRAKYADVMSDKSVTNISGWTEPNTDSPCDEQGYRDRALRNADDLNSKIKDALSFE
jgi:hypothetical protein